MKNAILESICLRKNFWTHNCYTELIFDRKTNAPKYEADRKQLYHDIRVARDMRELLYDKQMKLFELLRSSQRI